MSVGTADALKTLENLGDAADAAGMAAYHKPERRYIGVRVPVITALAKEWRAECTLDERIALADGLWQSDIHEARVAAAKLLEQARIRPDAAVWDLIAAWVPDFDGWALADHACTAGQKRLVADPVRIETVEGWTASPDMWTRRAALVMTLPWARMDNLKPADTAVRERILGWAAGYVPDKEWFIQKAIGWWLRELSKHDAGRVQLFLDEPGAKLANFARAEASKYL